MPWSHRTYKLAFLFAGAAVGVVGCGRSGGDGGTQAKRAPEFALKDLDGNAVRLSDFRGKVLLLDFWATWCEPCRQSMPFFKSVHGRYRGRGLEVVGVSEDVASDAVARYVRENKVPYAIVLDSDNAAFEEYGIRGLPTTFILDGEGRIRQQWIGFDDAMAVEMEATVQTLLRERGG